MDVVNLKVTEKEKDLGMLIDNKLDFGKYIRNIVGKANRVFRMIRVSFAYLNIPMFLNLYTSLVRPLIEYCVQIWSPYKIKYIKLLEGVDRRATRLVSQLKGNTYEVRLKNLGLTSLEDRRKRGGGHDRDVHDNYKERKDRSKKAFPNGLT